MNLISMLVVLLVFSLILWLISTYTAPPVRNILTIVVVLLLCAWLLSLIGGFGNFYIGTHR